MSFGDEAYPASSPLRREHVRPLPTLLTTSFSGQPLSPADAGTSAGYVPTPLSTSSLSSPFTQNIPLSPGTAVRGSSPMSNRVATGYNAPYNPQEWAPVGRSSPRRGSGGQASHHVQRHAQQGPHPLRHSTDDPVGSPPPPYSPRRDEGNSAQTNQPPTASAGRTPAAATNVDQHDSHPSLALSRPGERQSTNSRLSPRPLSIAMNSSSQAPRVSSFPPLPPPPPPPPKTLPARGSLQSSGIPGDRSSQIFGPSLMTAQDRRSGIFTGAIAQEHRGDSPVRQSEVGDRVMRPPASRRAVSASGVDTMSSADVPVSLASTPHSGWTPGMPLPPPPPGPPPGASRSQSASGVSDTSSHSSSDRPPWSRTRHQSYLSPSLGPIPPTPAGWVDEDQAIVAATLREESSRPLQVDTRVGAVRPAPVLIGEGTVTNVQVQTVSPPANRNSMQGLFRSAAIRDPSAKGIRERRIESRTDKQREGDLSAVSNASSNNPWQEALDAANAIRPANLDLTNIKSSTDRRSATGRIGPRSGGRRRTLEDGGASSGRVSSSGQQSSSAGSGATIGHLGLSFDHLNDTPPFSPAGEPCSPGASRNRSPALPPKALPTPPPQQYSRPPSSSSLYAPSSASDRPISHLFHVPNEAVIMPAPLTPRKVHAQNAELAQQSSPETDAFFKEALVRHQNFLEREKMAETDIDRLQLFTDFIVSESALRRQRYSEAWDHGVIDLDHVRTRLFTKPRAASRRGSGLRISMNSLEEESLSRPEPLRAGSYQPMLSPIAASMSNGYEEMSSRGRAPSRWWESQTGSSEGAGRQIERRSKRETKYMGVPREVREAMQYEDPSSYQPGSVHEQQAGGEIYGADEYPPEKVGLHEQSPPFPSSHSELFRMDTPQTFEGTKTVQPSTPASKKLDVSRFVTLPPPYPRHYPAVQNHHPDLIAYRTHVRTISDHDEIVTRKREFAENMTMVREAASERTSLNRQEFRAALSQELSQGKVSFAEAADAEAAFKLDEQAEEKKQLQSEFDSFQELVLNPLQDLLNERIRSTSGMITQLQSTLSTESQRPNPNQIAEEGDEQAELLEKLTVFKWLFEARENLHREMFSLELERSEKYHDLVTLPYKQTNNQEKLASTSTFFLQDEQSQRVRFETEVLARHEGLLKTIEVHVARGVELQLSSFWDITPPLVSLLQKIPKHDLGESPENMAEDEGETGASRWYGIQVPADELGENPSYSEHPLQYLHSLLDHTEKSTYQFIESQINLLCLLHEVRCGTLLARSKLDEARHAAQILSTSPVSNTSLPPLNVRESSERTMEQQQQEARERIQQERQKEEDTLTTDLKDRVSTVEGLWIEALGSHLQGVKEEVKNWLISTGGWEGMEDRD